MTKEEEFNVLDEFLCYCYFELRQMTPFNETFCWVKSYLILSVIRA